MWATYEVPKLDPINRAVSRLLEQFQHSEVLIRVLNAFTDEIKALRDAAIDVQNLRLLEPAVGVELDALGRIVGQTRTITSFTTQEWFTWDDDTLVVEFHPFWVLNAPLGEGTIANDYWYKQLIAAKITRNSCQSGSIPEIQRVVQEAYGIAVGIEWVAPMKVNIITPEGTPSYVIDFLSSFVSGDYADDVPNPPYPATLEINNVGVGFHGFFVEGAQFVLSDGNPLFVRT
jgi:hypothetical protein